MTTDEYKKAILHLLDESRTMTQRVGEVMLRWAGSAMHRRMAALVIKRAFRCSGGTMPADGEALVAKLMRGEEIGATDPGQLEVGMVAATWAAVGADDDYALLIADFIAMLHAEHHKGTETTP